MGEWQEKNLRSGQEKLILCFWYTVIHTAYFYIQENVGLHFLIPDLLSQTYETISKAMQPDRTEARFIWKISRLIIFTRKIYLIDRNIRM